jgi:hypothetical protein
MECKITNLVYQNDKIKVDETIYNNKRIFSNSIIPKHTILFIEHVFCDIIKDNSVKHLLNAIRFSPSLYNSLYPRTKTWSIDDLHNKLVFDKLQCNAFRKDDKVYIGNYITKTNHSLQANAKAFVFDYKDGKEDFPLSFIAIITIKDIQSNEEILIKYNDNINFGIKEEIENINLTYEIHDATKLVCIEKIQTYQTSEDYAFCRTHQIGVYNGLFCYQSKIFYNDSFESYCKHLGIENTLECRKSWFETVFEEYNKN